MGNKDVEIEKAIKILENVIPDMLYYDPDLISCTLNDYMSAVNVALNALKEKNRWE